MEQTKKLTRQQKELIFAAGITPVDNWSLVEESDMHIKIEHKITHTRRKIDKYRNLYV